MVITLTNYEIKYIMIVIKSLENREILLKRTIREIATPEGGFLSDKWQTFNEKRTSTPS